MKWKPVPVEPDDEQREAGHRAAWRRIPSLFDEDDAANVYRSMLAAAPAAPAASEQNAVSAFKSVTPDCNTCANRGATYGLSQESCCSHCIYGEPRRKNLYQPDANKLSAAIAAEKGGAA